MTFNTAPFVNAGPDLSIASTSVVASLNGVVTDDALPTGQVVTVQWRKLFGPGQETAGYFSDKVKVRTSFVQLPDH